METRPDHVITALQQQDHALSDYLRRQRWFGGKGKTIDSVTLRDCAVLSSPPSTVLAILDVRYRAGGTESYFVPLTLVPATQASEGDLTLSINGTTAHLTDAAGTQDAALMLVDGMRRECLWKSRSGSFASRLTAEGLAMLEPPLRTAKRLSAEQSNTSILYDDRVILKVVRKLQPGINPDREILDFLTTRTQYRHVPVLVGALDYEGPGDDPSGLLQATAAIAQVFIPNDGDAWRLALAEARATIETIASNHSGVEEPDTQAAIRRAGGPFLSRLRRLGVVTGELHAALASDPSLPAFRPESITATDLRLWRESVERQVREVFGQFEAIRRQQQVMPTVGDDQVRELERRCLDQLAVLEDQPAEYGVKIRVHGDYHLGQVLSARGDFTILDFEGEPARSVEERRAKLSALKDVAGMLRSLDYAGHVAVGQLTGKAQPDIARIRQRWVQAAEEAFLDGYRDAAPPGPTQFVPRTLSAFDRLLRLFLLEKAVYELSYEFNNRPDWVVIPFDGLRRIVSPPRHV